MKKKKNKATKKTAAKKTTDGQPFFAMRASGKLLKAFRAYAKKNKATPGQLIQEFMSSTTGVQP